jgi:hypothetical protein
MPGSLSILDYKDTLSKWGNSVFLLEIEDMRRALYSCQKLSKLIRKIEFLGGALSTTLILASHFPCPYDILHFNDQVALRDRRTRFHFVLVSFKTFVEVNVTDSDMNRSAVSGRGGFQQQSGRFV